MFLAKSVTVVAAVIAIIVAIAGAAVKPKPKRGELVIENVSEQLKETKRALLESVMSKDDFKQLEKDKKKDDKKSKKETSTDEAKARVFVINFNGGLHAEEVSSLREEVTAVLLIAEKDDEVVIKLESGGGVVHGYGLAASQLKRIRDRGIKLTVAVDKVAASGGYMMACVADKILAAPFAILGSIGVLAQIPNFNKLLKKHDIEFEQLTAGDYKRTLTMFGENTDKAREKFKEELEETHELFKSFVVDNRESLNIAEVATGEHWFGYIAKEKGLVDELSTSDDYLMSLSESANVYSVQYTQRKGLPEKLGMAVSTALESVLSKFTGMRGV